MDSIINFSANISKSFYITNSLPMQINDFVSREPLIKTVKNIFSEDNLIVIVEGNEFSGKTYFLKEFYENNITNSIAYFITQERWLWNIQNILTDLIQQMSMICSPKMKHNLQKINFLDVQLEKIKHIFRELCKDLISIAVQTNKPFYFVIDGLDKMDEKSRNALLETIPLGDERGVFLLLSRRSELDFEIEKNIKSIPISNFSLLEVKSLMSAFSVSDEQIDIVYQKSDGLAGYIGQVVKDLKRNNYEIEHFINHLPSNIENLLIKNWDNINDDLLKKVIKVIVYSPERFKVEDLAIILNTEILKIKTTITKSDLIKKDNDEKLKLENIYLEFLYKYIEDERNDIEYLLIEYYENKESGSLEQIEFLPRLYANKGNYEKIKMLVDFESLNLFFKDSHLSSLMFENIGLLKKMAYSHKDWQKMSSSIMLESIFKQTNATLPSINKDVEALLALEKYDEALRLIALCSLNEDKLVLLSNTCKVMIENGLDISSKIIKELDFYIESCRINKELGIKHAEKFSLIGANLSYINIELTMKLIRYCLKDISNNVYKKYIADYMIVHIFLTLNEKEEDSIKDTNLHEFVTYLENEELKPIFGTFKHGVSFYSDVYSTLEKSANPYIKLFVLLNWCENNIESKEFIHAVKTLITIFSEEAKDIVKLSDVLRLINCLLNKNLKEELEELEYIILRLTNLYQLIKPSSYLERIQIELGIIKLKVVNGETTSGFEQLLDLYINNLEIQDLDLRCLGNCYLLNLINESEFNIFNSNYYEDIKRNIIEDLNKLMISSSNQAGLMSDIFYKLALMEPNLALSRAYNVNTEKSRVIAYNKIFNALIENGSFKLDDLKEILKNVEDRVYKDQILINTIKQLVINNDDLLSTEEYKVLLNYSKGIESPQGRLIFLVYLVEVKCLDINTVKDIYGRIKNSLNTISDNTIKESLAVFIIKKLVKNHYSFVEEIWKGTFSDTLLNYRENRLEVFYKEIIVLMNRSLVNVLKIENNSKIYSVPIFVSNICNQIESVESKVDRAYLYADLALRGIKFNRPDLIQRAIVEYKKIILDDNLDIDSLTSILSKTGSLLCMESWIEFKEVLDKIKSNSQKNAIITNIIHLMAIGRPYHDNVDFTSAHLMIDSNTINAVINLLKEINYDANLYHCINIVIDAIITSYSENSSKRLNQGTIMVFVDEVKNIIKKVLPTETVGIKHDGYIIAIESALLRLKSLKLRSPALLEKKNLPTYDKLRTKALQIPNISDRVFVLAKISLDMSTHEKEFSNKVLEQALADLENINNSDDFNSRASVIISAYLRLKNNSAALYIIGRVMEKIKMINDEEESEKYIEELINFCYEIDPNEAKNYVDSIKSRTLNHELTQKFKAKKYHYQPQKILDETISQNAVLENFFKYSLKSIYGNRGTLQAEEVIGEYLYSISTDNSDLVIEGLTWYVENVNLGSNISISRLDVFFNDLLMSIQLIKKLNKYLFDVNQSKIKFDEKMILNNEYDYYFSAGEHERAYNFLIDWINRSVENHLIIYDPYFSVENLKLFKQIKSTISTTVFLKASENEFLTKNKEAYQNYWKTICDTVYPEITFMVFVTKSGETPLHDRFLLSEVSGLDLGTSINGFHSKDFGIKNLDKQEVDDKKGKFVEPLLYNTRREHNGHPMRREIFNLL